MIVGAAVADGAGAVLGYRSTDLLQWRYAGVVCRGHASVGREVWECPQMIQIEDGDWALVVSVQVDGSAGHVAACVGSFDGTTLAGATPWQRLAFGPSPYATSLFRDRDGRPCMISWLREDANSPAAGWSGAYSLVAVLGIDGSRRVVASPHPAVLASQVFTRSSRRHDLEGGGPTHLTVARPGGGPTHLTVARPGSGQTELFVDADILEIFAGGRYRAWRRAPTDAVTELSPACR